MSEEVQELHGPVVKWSEREGDYYSIKVQIYRDGLMHINRGGFVYAKHVKDWHDLGKENDRLRQELADAKEEIHNLQEAALYHTQLN